MSGRTLEELEEEYERVRKEIYKLKQEKAAAYEELPKIKSQHDRYSNNNYDYADCTLREIAIKRLEDKEAYERYKQLRRKIDVRIPQDVDTLITDLRMICDEASTDVDIFRRLQ